MWKCKHCENEAGKKPDEEASIKDNQQHKETEETNQGNERPTEGDEQLRDEGETQADPCHVNQKCLHKEMEGRAFGVATVVGESTSRRSAHK